MLKHIRLLIFDLDYLVFDCAGLKAGALRESLKGFADEIPHDVRLPDEVDVEEGFREHGFRWPLHLDLGLDENRLASLQGACHAVEQLLVTAGAGRVFPGLPELLSICRRNQLSTALGAEARRAYVLAVSDRHDLHGLFEMVYCTEEYGAGGPDEMIEDMMARAEVNPSETLVLGTLPSMFHAARALDVITVGCGWGLRSRSALKDADLQVPALANLMRVVERADATAAENSF